MAFGSSTLGASSFGAFSTAASPLSYITEPPDLSEIPDPTIVVVFKNLLKKDENTKVRALEDLLSKLKASGHVDDAVVAVWVRIYPRLSIDTSRRVRQLSSIVIGTIGALSGRRFAKQMPKVVAPWLAGLYDSDRVVSRATRDSLVEVFNTEEKLKGIWKVYSTTILEYCTNVVENEKVYTLSDERSTSADDAEAKFARVMTTIIMEVAYMINSSPEEDLAKTGGVYEKFLKNKELWKFAYHSDPALRRAIYRLLLVALDKHSEWISTNLKPVSSAFLSKAFGKPQTTTADAYLEALEALVKKIPEAWGSSKAQGKKTPLTQLAGFLEQGSQLSPPIFWDRIAALLAHIPADIITTDWDSAVRCTTSIRKAIKTGKEPRTHTQAAWGCYFDVCYRLLDLCNTNAEKSFSLGDSILPVYSGFLDGNRAALQPTSSDVAICTMGLLRLQSASSTTVDRFLDDVWRKVENHFTQHLNANNDDRKLKILGENWVELATQTVERVPMQSQICAMVQATNRRILGEAIEAINSSNGTRVGAAAILECILKPTASMTWTDPALQTLASRFFEEDIVNLIDSPSVSYILRAFITYGAHASKDRSYGVFWSKVANGLLVSSHDAITKEKHIQTFIETSSRNLGDIVEPCPELDGYITRKFKALLNSSGTAWTTLQAAVGARGNVIGVSTVHKLLQMVADDLEALEQLNADALIARLDLLRHTESSKLLSYLKLESSESILHTLLRLSYSPEPQVGESAEAVLEIIRAVAAEDRIVTFKLAGVIRDAVRIREGHEEESLPIEFLAVKARALLGSSTETMQSEISAKFVFDDPGWKAAASPFLQRISKTSLAVTNVLEGCLFLVESSSNSTARVLVDSQGYSEILRMATMITRMFSGVEAQQSIKPSELVTLLHNLLIVTELLKDNISILSCSRIFEVHDTEAEEELTNILEELQRWVSSALKSESGSDLIKQLWAKEFDAAAGSTVEAFYSARSMASVFSSLVGSVLSLQEIGIRWLDTTDLWKESDVFRAAAVLTLFGNQLKPARKERICNELISDIVGIPADRAASLGTEKLVLLNSILPNHDEVPVTILPMRLTRLVKHTLNWFNEDDENSDIGIGLVVEVAKTLCSVLPSIETMYGEHWRQALDFIRDCWMGCLGMQDQHIPMLLASLKLFQIIGKLAAHGENDDVREEWDASKEELQQLLIKLLLKSQEPDTNHQPRNMCNIHIERQLKGVSRELVPDVRELYPILRVQSRPLQHAAYDILHRAIPELQEEVSINAAISEEAASQVGLPLELLSLIMEVPSTKPEDIFSEHDLDFRGYLLSWLLIFDHFTGASFKVRSIYLEALKEGQYLPPVLDKVFSFLLPQAPGRPFDASKYQVFVYSPSSSTSDPTSDILHLQAHLYYLTLRYTPSLVKSWYLAQTNRATSQSIESFTERYFSPMLIASELSTVMEYRTSDDTEDLTIRVLKGAREVSATYPVDDQRLEISVRLPAAFPLRQVEVNGVRRVGMDDTHFKRLLLASQAVVNFQSGSIIDALGLFRRNVTLHFQGVSECAICYSILAVTPDRALPNKACSTCKNKFHSTCLLKWFKTSNSSSCPLCRTSFPFYS